MSSSVRILIVDEQDAFRQTLRAQLASADDLTVVGEAQDRQTAIRQIDALKPDVVLLSLNAPRPDGAHGDVSIVARIGECCPHAKILVLGAGDDQAGLALDVFRQGAQGYLDKKADPLTEIVAAVRTISRGGAVLDPGMAGWILSEIACMRRKSVSKREEVE